MLSFIALPKIRNPQNEKRKGLHFAKTIIIIKFIMWFARRYVQRQEAT